MGDFDKFIHGLNAHGVEVACSVVPGGSLGDLTVEAENFLSLCGSISVGKFPVALVKEFAGSEGDSESSEKYGVNGVRSFSLLKHGE